jgi:hypothetical protein
MTGGEPASPFSRRMPVFRELFLHIAPVLPFPARVDRGKGVIGGRQIRNW